MNLAIARAMQGRELAAVERGLSGAVGGGGGAGA